MEKEKIEVLKNFLLEDGFYSVEELKKAEFTYENNSISVFNRDYLVLTEEEADEKAKEEIMETLWAFNAEFIAEHSSRVNSDHQIKAIRKMQIELCEDSNNIISALIDDIKEFVNDAIYVDGRGNFLALYDGVEEECEDFYIYRIN